MSDWVYSVISSLWLVYSSQDRGFKINLVYNTDDAINRYVRQKSKGYIKSNLGEADVNDGIKNQNLPDLSSYLITTVSYKGNILQISTLTLSLWLFNYNQNFTYFVQDTFEPTFRAKNILQTC